jgi:RecB family exonuclease
VELEAMLDEQWPGLEFGAKWFSVNERKRATRILGRLVQWLVDSRTALDLIDIERDFGVEVGDAWLNGRVDRLERDRDGNLVVIDLKTGKSKVKAGDMAEHPQLGAYQLAVDAGAFGAGERSGGAMLVQLAAGGAAEQRQDALSTAEDPDWIRVRVATVAERLRGSEFTATQNSYCPNCDLARCCPLQTSGRPVTS